ncbi:MAG: glycosyltransferase family 1 protein [Acidimicrobiales bacterium]|nr:glycosyltransferase family 1 protein [Acidimicrobiales bacterium]
MRILLWHVHGSWTTSFVEGDHTYVVPVVADRGPAGRGRARTWDWPDSVVERTPEELADEALDVVILQRPEEEKLAAAWTKRRPGRDLPTIWLEHNAPQGRIDGLRHPAADRKDLLLVHVTHTNRLFWDNGSTPTTVIEHGIVDPGHRYTGDLAHVAVVVNEPERRGRITGTDLLPAIAAAAPVDLFGMGAAPTAARLQAEGHLVHAHEDLPQDRLHDELAERRVYAHPVRWTSLGLALLEAMHLGMPVVALATTEVPMAVPPPAGVVTNDIDRFVAAVHEFRCDLDAARAAGEAARAAALERYGLKRFLEDWDRTLGEVAA